MNWKDVVKAIAPVVGTALGGPLGGTAMNILGQAILGDSSAGEAKITEAVMSGLSPEALVALKTAENDFALKMKEADIDVEKLHSQERLAYVSDTASARVTNKGSEGVFWLGVAVLSIFAGATGLVLWGAFQMLSGGLILKDTSAVAAAFGLVGTVIGYIAANAQQVVGYFFGSSQGAEGNASALSSAVKSMVPTNTK